MSKYLELFNASNFEAIVSRFHDQNTLQINNQNWEDFFIFASSLYEIHERDKALDVFMALNKFKNNHEVKFKISQILRNQKQYSKSLLFLEEAIDLFSTFPRYFNELGNIYMDMQDFNKALTSFKQSLKLTNESNIQSIILYNIGLAYHRLGDMENAITNYQESITKNDHFPNPRSDLGICFKIKGQIEKAIEIWKKNIEVFPNYAGSYNAYVEYLFENGQIHKAIELCKSCLKQAPENSHAWNNLALCQSSLRQYQSASSSYLKSFELDNSNLKTLSNYLLSLNYSDEINEEFIVQEHKKYAHIFGTNLDIIPSEISYSQLDSINIAYVSGDFNRHSVMEFIFPILKNHNSNKFKVYCFSNSPFKDDYTEWLIENTNFITIFDKTDEQVVEIIRKEKISLLVDLSGHTKNNRMTLFAKKPCPIQISWIGYATTTGLPAMDYRIVDQYTDPEEHEVQYVEKKIKFENSFLVFNMPKEFPITPAPILKNRFITFCSFNNMTKVSNTMIEIWSELLNFDKKNKLLLKDIKFADDEYVESTLNLFREFKVDTGQLIFIDKLSKEEHFLLYNDVDIALDTFPYNGTTTTFETLWMGVPIITLSGKSHQSRVTASILKNLDLEYLCAQNKKEYIEIALELIQQPEKIDFFKKNLRKSLINSHYCKYQDFTEQLENKYIELVNKL